MATADCSEPLPVLSNCRTFCGGFSEEIFLNLEPAEVEKYSCNICLQIARDIRQCSNKHVYCNSCIMRWRLGLTDANASCPVCRVADSYSACTQMDKILDEKMVKCPETSCSWAGKLLDYKNKHKPTHKSLDDRSNYRQFMEYREEREAHAPSIARIAELIHDYSDRLSHRRLHLEEHQDFHDNTEQEIRGELEVLTEGLANIGRRLHDLTANMAESSERYRRYIADSERLTHADPEMVTSSPPAATDLSRMRRSGQVGGSSGSGRRTHPTGRRGDEGRLVRLMMDTDEDFSGALSHTTALSLQEQQRVNDLLDRDDDMENPFTLPNI